MSRTNMRLLRYPNLLEVRMVPTKKDIAFVEYTDEKSSSAAKDVLHNYRLDEEHKIKVRVLNNHIPLCSTLCFCFIDITNLRSPLLANKVFLLAVRRALISIASITEIRVQSISCNLSSLNLLANARIVVTSRVLP